MSTQAALPLAPPTVFCLTIPGPPRTKKTHSRIVRVGKFTKILPSQAFCDWQRKVLAALRGPVARTPSLPIRYDVNCRAVFYRDAAVGDAVGYYQGLADILEVLQVVDDDKRIVSWDGSRLDKDARRPRVEVELREVQG